MSGATDKDRQPFYKKAVTTQSGAVVSLGGRPDCIKDDVVYEIKNRIRPSAVCKRYPPPEYDVIQLRCYMFLMGKKDGILVEEFTDGLDRKTQYTWDDQCWDDIVAGIDNALAKYSDLFASEARSSKIVSEYTVVL